MKSALLSITFFLLTAVFVQAQTLPVGSGGMPNMTPEQLQQLQKLTPSQVSALQQKSLKDGETKIKESKTGVKEVEYDYSRDTTILTYEDYFKLRNQHIRDSVKVFGRELFSQKDLTFAPSLNLPTPSTYILASGDELNINIWGAAEETFKVQVTPDGHISLTGIGLIQVGGMSIRSAEQRIKSTLLQKVEGIGEGTVFVNISLGNIRSIKVNIAGEARVPGTYTLPSLATLFNAMYVAGGVSDIGSVRDIRLYRNNKLIATLDVYDYLLQGKLEVDTRLEDNDLIVIQPYISLVKVVGAIKRPMIYEMKTNESVGTLIGYTGGFTGEAFTENVNVSRSATGKDLQMFTIGKAGFPYFMMMDADSVTVGKVTQTYANKLSITGPVWRPGNYELSEQINTLRKLVEAANGPKENAFLGRAQLIRMRDDQTKEVVSVNLKELLAGQAEDILLRKNDSLVIVAYDSLFQKRTLGVYGEVNDTMQFEYIEGMTLADIIMKAGGLKESASLARIEIARRVSNPEATAPSTKIADTFSFKISGDLTLSLASVNFKLMPFDRVYVRRSPGYNEQQPVYIEGEVVFDGEYTLTSNAVTLSQLIEKSGGFTPEANVRGAYLRRQKTEFDIERDRSVQKLTESGKRTLKDTIMIEKIEVGDYYSVAINLEDAVKTPSSLNDIVLKSGDKLYVPSMVNTVKISGGVYYPNTVTYDPTKKLRDYISMGGGYNQRARRKPFVIYQNGSVTARNKKIEPGCEIVIPLRPERNPMSPGEWLSIGTSVISMAAMVTSIFK